MKKPFETVCLYIMAGFILIMTGVFIGRNFNNKGGIFLGNNNATEAAASAGRGLIDINTATEIDLIMIPGIGETLAKRIVAYREQNGPFSNVADLLNVEGIGKQTLQEIQQYITVGG